MPLKAGIFRPQKEMSARANEDTVSVCSTFDEHEINVVARHCLDPSAHSVKIQFAQLS
jgi:hypothetical protein